jgi:hypothetical protein
LPAACHAIEATMSDDVQKAVTLLRHIRHQIEDRFPIATIEQTFNRTGNVYFRIQKQANRYAVLVTKRFLDAHDDVDTGLAALRPLGDRLQHLNPGKVLVVNPKGLSTDAAGA